MSDDRTRLDFFIIPLLRAGSKMLCNLFRQYNCAHPHETWGPQGSPRYKACMQYGKTPAEAHEQYVRTHCFVGGVSAIKLQPFRVLDGMQHGAFDNLQIGKVIYLVRNPLACALSFRKAKTTKSFKYRDKYKQEYTPSDDHLPKLHRFCREFLDNFGETRRIIDLMADQIYIFWYEDFAHAPHSYVKNVVEDIKGVRPEGEPEIGFRVQRTEEEEKFVERHQSEFDCYTEELKGML